MGRNDDFEVGSYASNLSPLVQHPYRRTFARSVLESSRRPTRKRVSRVGECYLSRSKVSTDDRGTTTFHCQDIFGQGERYITLYVRTFVLIEGFSGLAITKTKTGSLTLDHFAYDSCNFLSVS